MPPINVAEYEALARKKLHPAAWDFYSAGAEDEVTLLRNRVAFERITLRPRVLVDASGISLAATVLGTPVSMPLLAAPTAMHGLADPEAECATARGIGHAGTLMVASSESTCSLEEIASAATGPLWLQLYIYHERHFGEALVRRAEEAGCRAIVLTVDAPVWGQKDRSARSWDTLPEVPPNGNFPDGADYDPLPLTWNDVDWLRSYTTLPILLKGILTAEDARLAVEHGVEGIVVSNHGGRQLDGAPATIEALPEVVAAVREAAGDRCEIFLDGGVRRGTDVLKALALGARAVLLGRPVLWGLAVGGEEGVAHVLDILRDELERAMILAGCPTLDAVNRSFVRLPLS